LGQINTGYLCVAKAKKTAPEVLTLTGQRFFDLGTDEDDIRAYFHKYRGQDVYFSPIAYSTDTRTSADEQALTQTVYADADVFPHGDFRIAPSIVVETSPNRTHTYWLLDRPYRQTEVARVATKIAKAHSLDHSSGIATKMLRVPFTKNTKYATPYDVTIIHDTADTYTLEEIDQAYSDVELSPIHRNADIDIPPHLPELFDVLAKVPANARIEELMLWDKMSAPDPNKRSERRFELIRLLLEAGLTPEEALVVVWSCPVSDHYREQNRPIEHLWQFDIMAAVAKENTPRELEPSPIAGEVDADFIDADELEQVLANPGFIERWEEQNWRILHPKTPSQYVRLNGYVYLAGTLGNKVAVMPPGTNRAVFCNLYALNLGPTTSGKSEALFFLKRYTTAFSKRIGYEVVVGSNATAEGLIKGLKDYDKRTAMLVTDEVSGKFRQWATSPSMAHAREAELEIYDNYLPRNMRASDGAGSTEIVNLAFTQYMMGVDSEIESILDRGFLRSGYIPRCLIVKATRSPFDPEEHVNMPQGDPDRAQDADPMPEKFADMMMEAMRKNAAQERHGRVIMQFEESAWKRFLEWRAGLLISAEKADDPDIMRPMAIRFAVSCQKMMALLAYERGAGRILLEDVLRVLVDAELWWEWTADVVKGVADSQFARLQSEVLAWVSSKGGKARLSEYHTKFHSWNMRDRQEVVESLTARGVMREEKAKNGTVYLQVAA
jgi:hypothetical protein